MADDMWRFDLAPNGNSYALIGRSFPSEAFESLRQVPVVVRKERRTLHRSSWSRGREPIHCGPTVWHKV